MLTPQLLDPLLEEGERGPVVGEYHVIRWMEEEGSSHSGSLRPVTGWIDDPVDCGGVVASACQLEHFACVDRERRWVAGYGIPFVVDAEELKAWFVRGWQNGQEIDVLVGCGSNRSFFFVAF